MEMQIKTKRFRSTSSTLAETKSVGPCWCGGEIGVSHVLEGVCTGTASLERMGRGASGCQLPAGPHAFLHPVLAVTGHQGPEGS